MAKKQSGTKRTQAKDLPRKEKKLSAGDAKRVKGGWVWSSFEGLVDPTSKPGGAKGGSWPK